MDIKQMKFGDIRKSILCVGKFCPAFAS